VIARWKRVQNDVIGYDESNRELIRVPLREPSTVRAPFDSARGVARTNIS
jgi:hypothetical protein